MTISNNTNYRSEQRFLIARDSCTQRELRDRRIQTLFLQDRPEISSFLLSQDSNSAAPSDHTIRVLEMRAWELEQNVQTTEKTIGDFCDALRDML